MMPVPITIVGGGVAGLSLGIALRRRGVPVVLFEAGRYPRHRVCGEFLCGATEATRQRLGVADLWENAPVNVSTIWYDGDRQILSRRLPFPALGLSRRRLDAALADRFRALGGELHEGRRLHCRPSAGTIWATGKKNGGGEWLGLKAHFESLSPQQDLEMHLGNRAYVGLTRVEDGRVNVCGLLRRRRHVRAPKRDLLIAYLRASGLNALAARLSEATMVPESLTATAALDFGVRRRTRGPLHIGDAYSAIAPFTGNGLSVALESADECVDPVLAFSRGAANWDQTCDEVRRRLHARFGRRLRTAALIHPLLFNPPCRRMFCAAERIGFLPFDLLFRALR